MTEALLIFLLKYTERITALFLPVSLLVAATFFFLMFFRNKIQMHDKWLKWSVYGLLTLFILIAVFAITFLPFVIGHFSEFLQLNPFITQSTALMPGWLSMSCVVLAAISYFLIRKPEDVVFYGGFFLFVTIAVYGIYQIITVGWHHAYLKSRADISYFILCVPFFMMYLMFDTNSPLDDDFKTTTATRM